MRRSFTTTIAVLAICGAMIVGTVGVSAASVAEKGTKKQFCAAAVKVSSDVEPSGSASGYAKKTAAKLEKSFHKLEAKAPTSSLKKSVATMSDYFGRIADGDSVTELAQDIVAFGKAGVKFATYVAKNCVSTSIPSVSIPTLP